MAGAMAYFLTWTCHGTWLPGDVRGSVDAGHNRYGTPVREHDPGLARASAENMTSDAVRLNSAAREIVERAIRDHCLVRGSRLIAINVRSNHVHVVVASNERPEIVMGQFKAWATRRLREAGLAGRGQVWTREGSTKYLFHESDVAMAVDYVNNHQ